MAMRNIGVDYTSWFISDWNIIANKAYKEIHHQNDNKDFSSQLDDDSLINKLVSMQLTLDDKTTLPMEFYRRKGISYCREVYNEFKQTNNLGSITQVHGKDLNIVDKDQYSYFMFYSWPCQDLSCAGYEKGMTKGSGTRSALLWEVGRILQELKEINGLPDVLICENVKQVTFPKHKADFDSWREELERLGYKNTYSILNARDYGVPQNRERFFMVSTLDHSNYVFPKTIPLEISVKSLLEQHIDEKYYMTKEKTDYLVDKLVCEGKDDNSSLCYLNYKKVQKVDTDIAKTLMARDYKGFNTGFDTQNAVVEPINLMNDKTCRTIKGQYYKNGVANLIRQDSFGATGAIKLEPGSKRYKIRKLTPTECARLMGVSDEDNAKLMNIFCNTQIYHLYGNSIVVNVLEAIFRQLHIQNKPSWNELHKKTRSVTSIKNDNEEIINIRQSTKIGYIGCENGGVASFSYATSKNRRGRVIEGGNITPTIMANESDILRIERIKHE